MRVAANDDPAQNMCECGHIRDEHGKGGCHVEMEDVCGNQCPCVHFDNEKEKGES